MFGFKKPNYSVETIGTITRPSAVQINGINLPLAEYEVAGQKYEVRVPSELARAMELKAKQEAGYEDNLKGSFQALKDSFSSNNPSGVQVLRNNNSFGTNSFEGTIMFTVGKKVVVKYDPEKPKKAIVTGEYNG